MEAVTALPKAGRWYNAVWRWHFYAGMLCIPFVIWLACTGAIYLWRPQLEAWLDRPYDHLAPSGPAASPDAQVAAALAVVPGSTLHKYVLPDAPDQAVRILVTRHGEDMRVYVHPRTLAILKVAVEEKRPFRMIFHLHGELLAGAVGSYLVETATCWTVVMLLTGLYLWWPRGRRGLAGVLYPRLRSGRRLFWRDIHATAGIWVSVFALALILTGLPWAKGWGSYLTEIRQVTGTARGPVDWTIGGKPPKQDTMSGDHAGHGSMVMAAPAIRPGELARVVAAARMFEVAPPVLISPPTRPGAPWAISSDAADRPLRSDLKVDGASGRIVSRVAFAQRHWIDRAIGYGVAGHEGALFGIANQIIGTATALLLVVLAGSGAIMWWRRRPSGLLGAPVPSARPRFGIGLLGAIGALGLYLPLFGASLIGVLLLERLLFRFMPATRRWLGLEASRAMR
ncbi:PepSY-associated TM helix domain-containing protein [Sphingomonas sp. MMS24-J13]|uniref:PepSY-associated TM helix domain-containing protein n=1 Tax=Sphingomonas sp. MMS24-J13 TaxID=3238686 RepID=UPI00384C050C